MLAGWSLSPSRPSTFLELAIEDLAGESLGGHADYIAHPTQVSLGKVHIDAGCVDAVKDVHMRDSVLPGHTQDPLQAADVKCLKRSYVPVVWCPGFRAIQRCGRTDCFVYSCFCRNCQVSISEDSAFKPTEGRRG